MMVCPMTRRLPPGVARLTMVLVLTAAGFAEARPTTFASDVAPLLFRHCVTCHRPDGASATSFLTYESARAHARQIVQMTAERVMPPWQPDGPQGMFEGDRRLATNEIDVFRRWLDDGLLEGEADLLPPTPTFPRGWELGPPDLVVTMPAYTLRADGPDMFRNFVLTVPGDRMRYVRAWEFRAGSRVVHHATMQVDATGSSRRYDEADPAAGYEGLIAPAARAPDGFFLDWAPGHRPSVAVPGTAWPLPASSDLVMMLHLRPSGRPEQVQASLALYFADTPPERTPVMLRLTRQDLDILPGATDYAVTDRYVLPVDVEVRTVQPHAHYLAREMTGMATRPDGVIGAAADDSRLGFQLAGRVSLRRTAPAAGGHDGRDDDHLRQLVEEPAQPEHPSGQGWLRPADVRRNGRDVVPGSSGACRGAPDTGRQPVSKGAAGRDQGTRIDGPPRPVECRVAR